MSNTTSQEDRVAFPGIHLPKKKTTKKPTKEQGELETQSIIFPQVHNRCLGAKSITSKTIL